MLRDEEIIANLPAYALGALDDDEQRAVEELVERDLDAADELAEMLDTVADISARVGEETPPVGLRQSILSAVTAEPDAQNNVAAYSALVSHIEQRIAIDETEEERDKTPFWQKLGNVVTAGRLAFATSIASFAVVAIAAVQLGADNVELNRKVTDMEGEVRAAYSYAQDMSNEISSTEQLLAQAHERLAQQDQEIVRMSQVNDAIRASMTDQISLTYATLRNEYQSPEWQPDAALSSGGYAYLLEHRKKPLGALVIGGVEQAPAGEEYRLYLINGDEPEYIVSFNMNDAGYSTVVFDLELPLSIYNGAHITRERVADPPDPSLAAPENRYSPQ